MLMTAVSMVGCSWSPRWGVELQVSYGSGVLSFRRPHLNQWKSEQGLGPASPRPMPARVPSLTPRCPPATATPPPLSPGSFSIPGIQLTCPVPPPHGTREPTSRQGEAALWWRKYCVLVLAMLLPLSRPGTQNVAWKGLRLPHLWNGVLGPICSIHFPKLLL